MIWGTIPPILRNRHGIYKGVALTIGCIKEIHQDLIHSISVYPNNTRPEVRKSRKQCADFWEVKHQAVH